MIVVRGWEQNIWRQRTLRTSAHFDDWREVIDWLTTYAVKRVGLVYEIEEYTSDPGDAEGE